VKRFFGGLNLLLFLFMLALAIWAWPRLPDQIPTHFGIDGRPDAWSPKTVWSWFDLPVIALLIAGLLGLTAKLPRWKPQWTNLPDRRKLTDLHPAARPPVLEMLEGFMALIQTQILVIFLLIQVAAYRAALGHPGQGIMITVLILALVSSPFFLVVFFLRLQAALEKGKELAAAAETGAGP
jgi:uncharacterized membrane protein